MGRIFVSGTLALFFVCLASIVSNAQAATVGSWSKTCVAPNWMTGAPVVVPDTNVNDPSSPFWGFTSRQPGGNWLTQYNVAKISGPMATRAVLIFLFFHECAHAQFNSADEGIADCRGLEALRRDMPVTDSMIQEITAAYASVGRPFPSAPCSF